MVNLDFNLHKNQLEVFNSDVRFKVCAAGRRAGKTYLATVMLIIHALKDKNRYGIDLTGKETWYIAPTRDQGKKIMWKQLKNIAKDITKKVYENDLTITLVNGRTIEVKGSDRPDTLRGSSLAYVVLDEYAFMRPEVWDMIISPALADTQGEALFIGTPFGKNHFFDLWVEAGSGVDKEWEAFQFSSIDNPIMLEKEIEKARNRMSAEAFRQEFEASFSAAGGGAFKEQEFQWLDEPKEAGSIYIAYDPAGFSDGIGLVKSNLKRLDEHAIAVVEVGPSGWFVHEIIHGRWGIREASLQLIRAAQKYKPVAVGVEKGSLKNAIMPYLEDQMRRLNIYPVIANLTHGGKRKVDRIMWSLQGRFQNGKIFFKKNQPWNNQLVTQLLDFPNPMAHDDLIDALSYIDQISTTMYNTDLTIEEYEPLDELAGY